MAFQVSWMPSARDRLAEIWVDAPDRADVARAANLIDQSLRDDPATFGESREGNVRLAFAVPLVVTFEIFADDCRVNVLSVKRL